MTLKKAAIIALAVMILCGGITFWTFQNCRVTVTGVSAMAVDASSQPELFNQLAIQVMEDAVIGTRFSNEASLSSAEDYQFITYQVQFRNGCFVPAEMVEVQITPMGDDVMQIGSQQQTDIAPGETGIIDATILTGKTMHPVREIIVTCYILGKPIRTKCVYGQ